MIAGVRVNHGDIATQIPPEFQTTAPSSVEHPQLRCCVLCWTLQIETCVRITSYNNSPDSFC
jgi:hypothetical protein